MEIANALALNVLPPATLTATGNQTGVLNGPGACMAGLLVWRIGVISGGTPTGSLAITDSADNVTFLTPASGAIIVSTFSLIAGTFYAPVPLQGLRKYIRAEYIQTGAGNVPADAFILYLPKLF